MAHVICITGLGDGEKSSTAKEVAAALRADGVTNLLLEGAAIREIIGDASAGTRQ
jgi:adenylylsulfate kinase-like enzyme